jgi:osmotically-inducible protein OsmY
MMRLLFGAKYDDAQLDLRAVNALEEDPLVKTRSVAVTSKNGIVTLRGTVHSSLEKSRVRDVVQQGLENALLKYERIVDNIVIE